MIIVEIDQNTPEWIAFKKGKVGGSGLKDIITERGNSVKIGVYRLLADRVALDEDIDDWRARGHILEVDAIDLFVEVSGIKLTNKKQVWQSTIDPSIIVSPDAYGKGKIPKVAVEVKCLSAAYHLEAILDYHETLKQNKLVLTDKIPKDFKHQIVQYFIVNEGLEELHMVFYNPSVESLPMHVITVNREDVADDIEHYAKEEAQIIKNVELIAEKLTF